MREPRAASTATPGRSSSSTPRSVSRSGPSQTAAQSVTASPVPPQIYKSTKCNDMQQSGSCPRGPFCAFAHVESKLPLDPGPCSSPDRCLSNPPAEPLGPEEPSFPTPSSPPSSRPLDPLIPEDSSSPSRHRAGSAADPFSVSGASCTEEQGLLGSVLSFCEHASGGAEAASPWAGDGGYCRAPGFEREDQVREQG